MTLLDEVMTWAAIVAAQKACVAAEMTTRLKQPVRVGQRITITGEVTRQTSRLLLTAGSIVDEAGEVLLTATGKYVPMKDDDNRMCSEDFVVSPSSIHPDVVLGMSDA